MCDEGHRLKAAGGNKTISALLSLRCPRRILVTGTPLQNNLEEFFGVLFRVLPGRWHCMGPCTIYLTTHARCMQIHEHRCMLADNMVYARMFIHVLCSAVWES